MIVPARSCASAVEAPEVRRHDHVGAVEQRRLGDRLRLEHVERGAGDVARLERLGQRHGVDQLAPGGVDDAHAGPHLLQQRGADDVARLGRRGQVERHPVGLGDGLLDGLGQLGAALAHALGADEGVVGDDAHAEPAGAGRDQLPDAAEADHRERLVGQLDAAEAAALPAPVDQRRVGLRDVAGQRQHQRDGVLGGRQRVRLRRVADQDAARRGRLDVDVVDARAGPADHAQPRRRPRSARRRRAWRSGRRARRSRRCARSSSARSRPVATSTSAASRSRSMPAAAIVSVTRTLMRRGRARRLRRRRRARSGARPRRARPRAPRGRARCRPPRWRRTSRCAGCGPRARPGRRRP